MKKLVLLIVIALSVSSCSLHNISSGGNALEQWTTYGAGSLGTAHLSDKQTLAVFYRTADFKGEALNVYINGDYQASLLDKTYTPVAVCANKQLISTSYTSSQQFGNRTHGIGYILPAKKVIFFRATLDAVGNPAFEQVEESLARKELQKLKGKVTHTLSRITHNKACKEAVLDNITLSARALWGLNKDSYADMLPQGKKEIAEFIEFVKGRDDIGRIEIRGYTDPEASAQYNLALSQRRANSVKQALEQAGVLQTISATGYGKTNLIVSDCAVLHQNKAERAKCNQPNRRVEITTYSK